VPDAIEGKHWNVEDGGCEGINSPNASRVDADTIALNYQLSKLYVQSQSFRTQEPARTSLNLAKLDYAKLVRSVVQQWIRDYIVRFNLCPYAEPVLLGKQIRYRVSFSTVSKRCNYHCAYTT
jgi:hypothetical protein